jgi:hypothetical protein
VEGDSAVIKEIEGTPIGRFALRAGWVAIRLWLVFLVGQKGALFFYQAF